MIRLIIIAFFLICDCTNVRGESKVVWQTAKQEQSVYVMPGMVADFSRDRKAQEALGRSLGAKTSIRGAVALYQLPASKKASKLNPAQSPVFADSPRGGNLRALPGGVVVTFAPAKNENQAKRWASDHGVELQRRLVETPENSVWLVKTVAGLESLNITSRLDASSDVVSAEPNWWLDIRSK